MSTPFQRIDLRRSEKKATTKSISCDSLCDPPRDDPLVLTINEARSKENQKLKKRNKKAEDPSSSSQIAGHRAAFKWEEREGGPPTSRLLHMMQHQVFFFGSGETRLIKILKEQALEGSHGWLHKEPTLLETGSAPTSNLSCSLNQLDPLHSSLTMLTRVSLDHDEVFPLGEPHSRWGYLAQPILCFSLPHGRFLQLFFSVLGVYCAGGKRLAP